MDKFIILKLYRAIGLAYLKVGLFNSAIGIFSHYVEALLKLKTNNPSMLNKINKELTVTRDVMCSYFDYSDCNSNNPAEAKNDMLKKLFGKTFENERLENFHREYNVFIDNNENQCKDSQFEHYAINLKFIQESLTNKTEDEDMLLSCAQQLFFLEQYDLVLDILKYLKKKCPHNTDLYFLKGQTLVKLEEYNKALVAFNILLKTEKNSSALYYYIGNLYDKLYKKTLDRKYLKKASSYFNKACDLNYDSDFVYSRTNAYLDLGDIKNARKSIDEMLKSNPSDSELSNYLWPFIQSGDFEHYKKYIDLRLNSSYIGEYYPKITNKPMWNCEKDISDKTLLVIVEQGFGDIFMYSRSLNAVRNKAKKIIFLTRPSTVKLFKYNYPDIEVLSTGDNIKEIIDSLDFDYHVPLMSLIKLWDFSKPAEAYLDVDPKDVRTFRVRHVDQLKFNIGIMYTSYLGDYFGKRNIPLNDLKVLTKVNDSRVYSFSVDSTLFNKQSEYGIVSLGKYFNDFYDTAVALTAMHIVVSTDNVILNLAGAMGIKTFAVLNNFNLGRFWKREGDDIGWYKSVKPFTAKQENEWDKLLARVNEHIEKYRISLKENYLLNVLKQIENNAGDSAEINIAKKEYTLLNLWKETYNKKYLDLYIDFQKKQLKKNPDDIDALCCMATIQAYYLGDKTKGLKVFEKIKDKIADKPGFLFNYGCLKFSQGDFDDFFKYYENRFIKGEPTIYPVFSQPKWKGETDTKDKTILVHFEQGFGDTILFSRYVPEIKDLFKQVYFVVQPQLFNLIKNSMPDINVCTNKNIETDYQVPLLSIPGILETYPPEYKKKKWLKVDNKKVKEFKQYFDKTKFNVGIYWNSSPSLTRRSIDLKTFLPIGKMKNVQLYSLDINKEDAELNYLDKNVNIINLGKHFKDFYDTASGIENCDLIICSDSVVLNLAGALGKKTFALFNKNAEWRWYKLDGDNTGWYKSVKPFHTNLENNYKKEIEIICKEIKSLIKSNN